MPPPYNTILGLSSSGLSDYKHRTSKKCGKSKLSYLLPHVYFIKLLLGATKLHSWKVEASVLLLFFYCSIIKGSLGSKLPTMQG